jgi:TonB dependent receptor
VALKKQALTLSPKISLAFGPWNNTDYYASWGQGFHSNDARGVTQLTEPATALVKTVGSEIGFRTRIAKQLDITLTLWQLRLGSELLFIGDVGTTQATRPSKRYGIEWTNTWRPLTWITVDADLAVSRARFIDFDPAGNKIPGSPQRVA